MALPALASPDRAETLTRLRAELGARKALGCVEATLLSTGLPELDARLGGWPRPGIAELSGPVGSGRLGLALPAMARETHADRWLALVDPLSRLYPPGLEGVRLDRLLLLRPSADKILWSAEQLLRSGVFPLVILLDAWNVGAGGRRLLHAAEEGRTCLLCVVERPDTRLPASLRLETLATPEGRVRVRVTRRRGGRGEGESLVL
jgi:hypothetical protein